MPKHQCWESPAKRKSEHLAANVWVEPKLHDAANLTNVSFAVSGPKVCGVKPFSKFELNIKWFKVWIESTGVQSKSELLEDARWCSAIESCHRQEALAGTYPAIQFDLRFPVLWKP